MAYLGPNVVKRSPAGPHGSRRPTACRPARAAEGESPGPLRSFTLRAQSLQASVVLWARGAREEIAEPGKHGIRNVGQVAMLRSLFRGAADVLGCSAFAAERYGGVRGIKVVQSLQKRCRDCRVVVRGRSARIVCETYRNHNQRQGVRGERKLPHKNARALDQVLPKFY
mmetsp:Transcript_1512/g.4592  ORF Transcript_1512/g.4592 Transcript_1512/m.4592 type:complete len:169 (+) Transcript_1512:152-658(+)